jgi:hypothetical protein
VCGIDEREGRRVAKALGLNVTGVLGILLHAAQQGRLSLRQAMADLQDKAGFWIRPQLYAELLGQSEESGGGPE